MCERNKKKFEQGTNFFLILVQHGGANIFTGLAHIAWMRAQSPASYSALENFTNKNKQKNVFALSDLEIIAQACWTEKTVKKIKKNRSPKFD